MTTIIFAIVVVTLLIVLLSVLVQQIRNILLPSKIIKLIVNGDRTLEAKTGNKLLNELTNAGIAVPSGCAGAGTCGLCKLKVLSGAGEILPTERALLTAQECVDGVRLACQITLQQDLSLIVAEDVLSAEKWNCTVLSTRHVSPLIKEIILELPEDRSFDYVGGKYVQISVPSIQCSYKTFNVDPEFHQDWNSLSINHLIAHCDEPVERAYSMANANDDSGSKTNKIVLLIRLALPPSHKQVAPGKMSSHLFSLVEGDTVDVSGPFGDFIVRKNDRDKVFIGGGVGMAPLRSMIHAELSKEKTPELHFYYGARSIKDLFYQEEFDDLMKKHSQFHWNVALSQPKDSDDWTGSIGFIHEIVHEEFIRNNSNAKHCDYYLCGPPLMLESVTDMLNKAGVDKQNIYADNFG